MVEKIKELFKREDGSMTVEIMVIMAMIGVIAGAIFTALSAGLSGSASSVGTKIDGIIQSWEVAY